MGVCTEGLCRPVAWHSHVFFIPHRFQFLSHPIPDEVTQRYSLGIPVVCIYCTYHSPISPSRREITIRTFSRGCRRRSPVIPFLTLSARWGHRCFVLPSFTYWMISQNFDCFFSKMTPFSKSTINFLSIGILFELFWVESQGAMGVCS